MPNTEKLLVSIYQAGSYDKALSLARDLIECNPVNKLALTILGASLLKMGQILEALSTFERQISLYPEDGDAHFHLGVTYRLLGRLSEAEDHYRIATKLNPATPEFHINLGFVLNELKRYREAVECCEKAISMGIRQPGIFVNLGNSLRGMGDYEKALSAYSEAANIDPSSAQAHNNMGTIYFEFGDLLQAETHYIKSIELHKSSKSRISDLAEVYRNLGDIYRYLLRDGDALSSYQEAFSLDPSGVGCEAAVWMSIHCYLSFEFPAFRTYLEAAKPLMQELKERKRTFQIYWLYLDRLKTWIEKNNARNLPDPAMEKIYCIGDSHSLSSSGVKVFYKRKNYQIISKWIGGCKQWHLAVEKNNKHKVYFENVLKNLPCSSVVMISVGEIDCRINEGIIAASKKYPNLSLESIATSTVTQFMDYLDKISSRYGLKIILSGVPAVNSANIHFSRDDLDKLAYVIGLVNSLMCKLSENYGFDFLDLYSMTHSESGVSGGSFHIDSVHLVPAAIIEAFEKNLIENHNYVIEV
ncbi:tetratricopeptide repeat protein [Allochromatium humboldtianum]|uniref:Tetratricopeptide repeat protein n=1 Tax=Allochromatium humboldtianum TaxID=504901 RepID=A0A850RME4_9GAMM|nr:tetratricopeptide repeat protein [Allochromatium humboldtianum]NVZ10113.1 tetratricopeptide repeat protein [Allochromatium humboldtianum]